MRRAYAAWKHAAPRISLRSLRGATAVPAQLPQDPIVQGCLFLLAEFEACLLAQGPQIRPPGFRKLLWSERGRTDVVTGVDEALDHEVDCPTAHWLASGCGALAHVGAESVEGLVLACSLGKVP